MLTKRLKKDYKFNASPIRIIDFLKRYYSPFTYYT